MRRAVGIFFAVARREWQILFKPEITNILLRARTKPGLFSTPGHNCSTNESSGNKFQKLTVLTVEFHQNLFPPTNGKLHEMLKWIFLDISATHLRIFKCMHEK